MNRYVLKFRKEGYMRYISHLDLLRLFKRSFSRIGVRLRHSEGFNPHPKMSFVQPLSLGYISKGEYLEFETVHPQDVASMQVRLNAALPEGISVVAIRTEAGKKALSARVACASYTVQFLDGDGGEAFDAGRLCAAIDGFLQQKEILREKKQKTGKFVTQDIRPMIYALRENSQENGSVSLTMEVSAGSNCNLNPEVLLTELFSYAGLSYPRESLRICRDEMYLQPADGSVKIPII